MPNIKLTLGQKDREQKETHHKKINIIPCPKQCLEKEMRLKKKLKTSKESIQISQPKQSKMQSQILANPKQKKVRQDFYAVKSPKMQGFSKLS